MKKAEQLAINQKVVDEYDKVMCEWQQFGCVRHVSRLRTCQADVFMSPTYLILRSCSTIVCAIKLTTGETYDFLRYAYGYTATSAQHISKFLCDYSSKYGNGTFYRYAV